MWSSVVLISLSLVASSWAGCLTPAPQDGFVPEKFTADWHLNEFQRPLLPGGLRCVHVQIYEDSGDHKLHGNVTALEDNGLMWHDEGKFKIKDPATPGRMTLVTSQYEAEFTILQTDYDDSAVFYICAEMPDGTAAEGMGIMGRSHELPEDKVAELKNVLSSQGVDVSGMKNVHCNA